MKTTAVFWSRPQLQPLEGEGAPEERRQRPPGGLGAGGPEGERRPLPLGAPEGGHLQPLDLPL